jgi:hypothetical protein
MNTVYYQTFKVTQITNISITDSASDLELKLNDILNNLNINPKTLITSKKWYLGDQAETYIFRNASLRNYSTLPNVIEHWERPDQCEDLVKATVCLETDCQLNSVLFELVQINETVLVTRIAIHLTKYFEVTVDSYDPRIPKTLTPLEILCYCTEIDCVEVIFDTTENTKENTKENIDTPELIFETATVERLNNNIKETMTENVPGMTFKTVVKKTRDNNFSKKYISPEEINNNLKDFDLTQLNYKGHGNKPCKNFSKFLKYLEDINFHEKDNYKPLDLCTFTKTVDSQTRTWYLSKPQIGKIEFPYFLYSMK